MPISTLARPRRLHSGMLIGGLLACAACGQRAETAKPAGQLTVAAAANLTEVFQQLGPEFERSTGIHPVFSFASTAQLAQQIENSAPFDLIAAADAAHVAQLEREGLLVPGSRASYATGVLALWIPPGGPASVNRLEDLSRPDVHVVAVAKPELAPYGQAAMDALLRLGIWDSVRHKIVYAENISMAREYGTSNNADAVFTAYSLVLKSGGKIIPVDESLHQPIIQDLGIIARSQHPEAARKFAGFLLSAEGRNVLRRYGYQPPR